MRLTNSGRGVKTTSLNFKDSCKAVLRQKAKQILALLYSHKFDSLSVLCTVRSHSTGAGRQIQQAEQCTKFVRQQSVPSCTVCVCYSSHLDWCSRPPLSPFIFMSTKVQQKHTSFLTCFFAPVQAASIKPASPCTLCIVCRVMSVSSKFASPSVWTHLKSVHFTFVHIFVFWSACVHCCQWSWIYR